MTYEYDQATDTWRTRGYAAITGSRGLSAPVARIASIANNLTVAFDGTSSTQPGGTITGYAWNFGESSSGASNTSTAAKPSHTYVAAGNYTVTLTVTGSSGLQATDTEQVTVTAPVPTKPTPTVDFTAVPRSATPLVVDFDALASVSSGSIAAYDWDFQQSTFHSTSPAAHNYQYNAAGTYTVKLTVTTDQGVTATATKKVTVAAAANQPPTVKISGVNLQSDGATVKPVWAVADSDGYVAKVVVDYGDKSAAHSFTGTASTPVATTDSYTYAASGTYTVTVNATDDDGASTATTATVTTSVSTGGGGGSTTVGDAGGSGTQQTGSGISLMQNLSGATLTDQFTAAGSNYASLQAKAYSFSDFAIAGSGTSPNQFRYGVQVKTAHGILGAGSKYSSISMVANTSKWASDVPAQSTGSSNQIQAVFTQVAGFKVDGVKLVFSGQGHLYNGLRLEGIASPTVTNTTILAAAGNAGSPPGETFGGINFQRATGTVTVTNVTVDGQNWAAAVLGSNSTSAVCNVTNLYTFNHPYSAMWASWQQTGKMTFTNCTMKNSARLFNAERLAAAVEFVDCMFDAPTSGHSDVNPTYDGGYTGGTIKFTFTTQAKYDALMKQRNNVLIKAVSNSTSVSNGLNKATVVTVWIAGVQKTGLVTWSGI